MTERDAVRLGVLTPAIDLEAYGPTLAMSEAELVRGYSAGPRPADVQCRVCCCTDFRACPGGCWWVEPDLCSSCDDEGSPPDLNLEGDPAFNGAFGRGGRME